VIDLEKLEGSWYVPILSLLLKCMKLQIASKQSIESTELKIGVAQIEFFEK
jgi:hypothetical protein